MMTDWRVARCFPAASLSRISEAIAASECRHAAQICFAVEGALSTGQVLRGLEAREHAIDVFSELRVWDTEANNGILIYLLLADHDVEIVADRGFNGRISAAQWETVCQQMEAHFRAGRFEHGVLAAIETIDAWCREHFPGQGQCELPNQPVIR